MRNMARLRRDTRPRWAELLAEVADKEELLLDELMRSVSGGERYYGGLVDPEEFRRLSRDAFRYLLGCLSCGAPPSGLAGLPRDIGARRAAQQVPLESLVTTVRSDFAVLWSTLLWLSRADDMTVLVAHVDRLWRAVDEFANEVQLSYLRESADRAELDRERQRAMITALFSAREPRSGLLRQVAGTLAVPEEGPYEVIAVEPADRGRLERCIAEAAVRGVRIFPYETDGAVVAFWAATGPRPGPLAFRCGHDDRPGPLAGVPERAAAATRVLHALPPEHRGPATTADVWDRFAAVRLHATAPELLDVPLAALRSCSGPERDRLLETVSAYLAAGSVAVTARTLYCHRNTVMTRMARFREVTGLDLTVPREAALATLLLALPEDDGG